MSLPASGSARKYSSSRNPRHNRALPELSDTWAAFSEKAKTMKEIREQIKRIRDAYGFTLAEAFATLRVLRFRAEQQKRKSVN